MRGSALLDYDNLREQPISPSMIDCEVEVFAMVDRLAGTFLTVFPNLTELDLRFYGGWTDESGNLSPDAQQLLPILRSLRGRRYGTIIRPTLARTMVNFSHLLLRGTVRLQAKRRRQKMVDGMLGCDALFMASLADGPVGVVTDDEDLIPAILVSHAANPSGTIWFRQRRAVGSGLNDRSLQRQGLHICCVQETA